MSSDPATRGLPCPSQAVTQENDMLSSKTAQIRQLILERNSKTSATSGQLRDQSPGPVRAQLVSA